MKNVINSSKTNASNWLCCCFFLPPSPSLFLCIFRERRLRLLSRMESQGLAKLAESQTAPEPMSSLSSSLIIYPDQKPDCWKISSLQEVTELKGSFHWEMMGWWLASSPQASVPLWAVSRNRNTQDHTIFLLCPQESIGQFQKIRGRSVDCGTTNTHRLSPSRTLFSFRINWVTWGTWGASWGCWYFIAGAFLQSPSMQTKPITSLFPLTGAVFPVQVFRKHKTVSVMFV